MVLRLAGRKVLRCKHLSSAAVGSHSGCFAAWLRLKNRDFCLLVYPFLGLKHFSSAGLLTMTHTGIGSATATTVTRCQDTSSSPCKLSMDGDMTPAVNRGLLTRDTLFKGLTLAATPQSILDPDALASPACPASTSGHSSVTSRSELARNRQSPIGRSSFVVSLH